MRGQKKVAIVTGATSGFGKIFAKMIDEKLKKSIDEIWIVGRREKVLFELANELTKDIRYFPMDLLDLESLKLIEESLEADDISIKMLVNAAGFGIIGDVDENTPNEIHDMVTLNCTVLTDLTKICLPYMSYNSRIINFASVAAFMPQPQFAVYAATKSYVMSFSRALNIELKNEGVYVTTVCPGPAETNFFNVAQKGKPSPWYKKAFTSKPEDVVEKAFYDSLKKKEVSVYSLPMNAMQLMTKVIPHKVLLETIGFLNRMN